MVQEFSIQFEEDSNVIAAALAVISEVSKAGLRCLSFMNRE